MSNLFKNYLSKSVGSSAANVYTYANGKRKACKCNTFKRLKNGE